MIKNIIFDMGNVLLDYNPDVPLNMYLDNDVDKAIIRKELFDSKEWYLKDLGKISDQEMYKKIAARIPERLHSGLLSCVKNWSICMKPIAGAKECIKHLRATGYGLYILSNAGTDFESYFSKSMPLSDFNGIVVSAYEHIVKPDAGIYHILLKRYHLNAKECLFIDDRIDNVEGARAVGINAVQFSGDYRVIDEAITMINKNES